MTSRKEVSGLPKDIGHLLDGKFNDYTQIFDDVMSSKKNLVLDEAEQKLMNENLPKVSYDSETLKSLNLSLVYCKHLEDNFMFKYLKCRLIHFFTKLEEL